MNVGPVRFWKLVAVGLMALAAAWGIEAMAQSERAPTAEEGAMLVHYRDAMHSILDQISNEDWIELENVRFDVDDDAEVSNDPDVPLDINESMQREYNVRPDSKLAQDQIARLQPLMEKFKASPTDPAIAAEIQKSAVTFRVTAQVHFNDANVSLDAPPASLRDLKLPGTAMAFLLPSDQHGNETVLLLFGNWKAATWDAGHRWMHFHFKRPGRYPAIENIRIDLTGTQSRIEELLKTIDWSVVNKGLTTPQ